MGQVATNGLAYYVPVEGGHVATVIQESEAQIRFPELIDRVLGGEDIVIARDEGVRMMLVPVGKRPRKPGRLRGQFTIPDSFFDPMTDEELAERGL